MRRRFGGVTMSDSDAGTSGPEPEIIAIEVTFAGRAGELWPIVLLNLLLNIITLSIYRFWARTRVRRFLWHGTLINGEPLEYSGRGMELFLGFLLVLFAVFLPLGIVATSLQLYFSPEQFAMISPLLYLILFFLFGAAIYRAWRYRLSRTQWRGIRFGLSGSWVRYAFKFLGFTLLAIVTFGWAYPWQLMRLSDQEMNNTWIGGEKFSFDGPARHLYGRFAALWFGGLIGFILLFLLIGLAVLTGALPSDGTSAEITADSSFLLLAPFLLLPFMFLGYLILQSAFTAKYLAVLMAATRLRNLTFRLNATAWSYAGLEIVNFLITVVTLGFGVPFAQMRRFRYFCDRLDVFGEIDVAAIRQSQLEQPGLGEGLADAFDIGAV